MNIDNQSADPPRRPTTDTGESRRRFQRQLVLTVAVLVLGVVLIIIGLVRLATRGAAPEAEGDVIRAQPVEIRRELPDGAQPDGAQPAAESRLKGSIADRLVEFPPDQAEHPLDPLLEVAHAGLEHLRQSVRDYTATMVKQERIGARLYDEEYMYVKVRHRRTENGREIPFSVYVRHLAPASMAGQEAIWVEGRHDGRLVAHTTGLLNLRRFYLQPTSMLAMRGNLHPITEIGIKNMIARMIEKGERDRLQSDCVVEVDRNVEFDGYSATMIRIIHPERLSHLEFHMAVVYIDDERNIPVGYEGYQWPPTPGGEPVLTERYLYKDIELNVGLTDLDFDPDNPDYDYP